MNNLISRPKNNNTVVGITLGDPAGIGTEVVLKAINAFNVPENVRILLIGDTFLVDSLKSIIDTSVKLDIFQDPDKWYKSSSKLAILNLNAISTDRSIEYGETLAKYGKVAHSYLSKAVELLKSGKIKRLITAPVNKYVINLAGIEFKGHTEFLAQNFNIDKVVMLLMAGKLKFALLTRHVSLKEVSSYISTKALEDVINLIDYNMKDVFGLDNARIGICGLNPHLGDNGLIGQEEKDIITPLVNELKDKYKITGPLPMYKLIQDIDKDLIDVIVCMYHDQGLIPLKLLYPEGGVNLTLGLPFIRTSPVHGTAYDIAGTGKASCKAMLEALKTTITL